LLNLLEEIRYSEIDVENNAEIRSIAEAITNINILPPKADNDRRHIATAIYARCNIIVSWNFEHMVNVRTIDGVRRVCIQNNLSPVAIYSPTDFLEKGGKYE